MIKFECSKCGCALNVPAEHEGKRVKCKQCGQVGIVPSLRQAKAGSSIKNLAGTGQDFMERNYDIFQALLKHEKEAPTIEVSDL